METGRPRIRWPFLLTLAVVGLVVRYTVLADGAGAGTVAGHQITLLEGVTGQGTKFELGIQNHRVYRLRTALSARCRGGSSVRETWYPAEHAPVHFTIVGRTFTTVERASPTYNNGVVGRVAFTIRGTLIGNDAARGRSGSSAATTAASGNGTRATRSTWRGRSDPPPGPV